ncbi:metallophosphoesterase family protein [Desulfotomaculum sp. 1211_IL3151]|uniref:metallophosphoesterase family protein n=1 Tax=Desulfotomaculum sp. 1211_IL3151 TaxID=3084055 RepID=UPI002FD9E432
MSALKFIHCSDIHLGRQRLGGKLPDDDFAKALDYIVQYALEQRVDGLLLAGDLYDSPNIQPPILRQATTCLLPLQEANIPVFAIEGNHDRATVTGETHTWVRYLNDIGLLHLLTIPFQAEGPVLTPWDEKTRRGSYIDYKGVRIVGAGYLGAGTIKRARLIWEAMTQWPKDSVRATVMLLHAGPDYMVQEGGGFAKETLEFLHQQVDYLALGHIHKPLNHGGWALNPGSPEHVRLEESRYDGQPRGMALVEIDPTAINPLQRAEILNVPKRRVISLRYDCSPHGNKTKRAMDGIQRDLSSLLKEAGAGPEDAVRLELTGAVNLGRIRLDTDALASYLEEDLPVLAVEINSGALQLANSEGLEAQGAAAVPTREALERAAIYDLVLHNPLVGLEEQANILAGLFHQFKEDVRSQVGYQEIRERLNSSGLVERLVQEALAEQPRRAVATAKEGED